jgi:cell division septum initiation protein DivIVA
VSETYGNPPGAHPDPAQTLSAAFARQIEVIVTTAEHAASNLAHEVEDAATKRAAEIIAEAERDAARVLEEAHRRSGDYLTASRRRIDEFAAERIRRLSELTDGLIEVAEAIQQRNSQVEEINRRLYGLISRVGDAAESVTREAAQPGPQLEDPSPDHDGMLEGLPSPPARRPDTELHPS